MQKVVIFILTAMVLGLSAIVVLIAQEPATSTAEIDRDRTAILSSITSAQTDADKYQGGAIKSLLDARVETLHHTLTMLEQKRTSILRRIALTYIINSRESEAASNATLNDILEELQSAEKRIAAAKIDAAQYSGGLVQSLKLLTVATEELSAAQLRMRFYTAKYGLPIPMLKEAKQNSKDQPVGHIVNDGKAL